MSRKAAKKATPRKRKTSSGPTISQDTQRDILALILLGLALLTIAAMLFPAGDLGSWWRSVITGAFGWGWPIIIAGVAIVSLYWLRQRFDEKLTLPPVAIAGAAFLLFSILGILHVVATSSGNAQAIPANGAGGGAVGTAVGSVSVRFLGRPGAFGFLLIVAAIGAILALGVSLKEIVEAGKDLQASASDFYRRSLAPRFTTRDDAAEPIIRQNGQRVSGEEPKPATPALVIRPVAAPPAPATRTVTAAQPVQPSLLPPPAESMAHTSVSTIRREWQLPPIDFLEVITEQELSQTDIRRRVKIIEETLANFHIQARVVEVNQGPAVTQFGVQPAAGVTVNRIVARQNDLSLALAASPIRIEAPVPGRSVVGVEVPNASISVVGLRSVIESTGFQKVHAKTKLAIALGQDVSGGPVSADLTKMPHLLIAGATGSGKSVCINAIIACLLVYNSPDDMKFIMVDPKMVELVAFNGIPHLLSPVVTEIDKVVNVLKWSTREMERRYRMFSAHGVRNIEAYNKGVTPKSGREYLPYIMLVIDELADIIMVSPDEVERLLCRLAQMARATGIHLVIATQRPSVDVITGLIKANFPARISFAVTSQVDSRVVLDMPGAEKLLGRGDMLYMASDSSSPVRLQGAWVSDKELEWLITFWRNELPAPQATAATDFTQPIDISVDDRSASPDEDPMLEEAKRVVQQAGHASVSLLQRKLRIGYSRAARMIDQMEADGIIGPEMGGSRNREVLMRSEGQ